VFERSGLFLNVFSPARPANEGL